MKTTFKNSRILTIVTLVYATLFSSCSHNNTNELQTKIDKLEAELQSYKAQEAQIQQRLATFDTLDFEYFTNQEWDKFSHSHTDDIVVYNADGSTTKGLYSSHIDDLKPMFIFAPDTKIEKHPVRFGSGDWTAVIGELKGTFSEPMPIGDGKTIPPTGKKFKLRMATIGHWKDGKMIEEYLFYDNQDFMRQIGLVQ
ncbi:ester cyclase [Mangrovimonas xylaniphaga]|uniref:ester cyclase n=1 Tax=Mangrovimonas xylaniphaga TaxID=1645915 RepID=UPI0006B64738|nr:ester cyclase [Mangrovimonas xylaniphaga]